MIYYCSIDTAERQPQAGRVLVVGLLSTFIEYTDRNVITIDTFDWLHRAGPSPPGDRDDPAYTVCAEETSVQSGLFGAAYPQQFERTFGRAMVDLLGYNIGSKELFLSEALHLRRVGCVRLSRQFC